MDKTQGDSNSITYEHAEQAVKNQAMATINMPDNENSDSSTGETHKAQGASSSKATGNDDVEVREELPPATEPRTNESCHIEAETFIQHADDVIAHGDDIMVSAQDAEIHAQHAVVDAKAADVHVQVEHTNLQTQNVQEIGTFIQHADEVHETVNMVCFENVGVLHHHFHQPSAPKPSKADIGAEHLDNGIYYYTKKKLRKDYEVYEGYKMYDGITRESIAVKIVKISNMELEREVKHLTRARHDNIVRFIDCEKCGERDFDPSYIAMELCDQGTLTEIVRKGCSYEYQKVMLLQIMHGVKYIHGLKNINGGIGIIHRDLKPQNILRSIDKRNMKLIDFGLGKCIDPEKSVVSKSKNVIGTEGWGSPEHYIKDATMSVKSDIFSAGLVFYFVLSNDKHAFGPEDFSWKHNICKGVEIDLSDLQCPDAEIARDLITKMLEHEPGKRPTAEEVLKHPFFWNEEKKLEFIFKIKKELHQSEEVQQQMKNLQKSAEVAYGNNWSKKLIISEETQRKYGIQNPETKEGPVYQKAHEVHKDMKYDHASVSALIRFIRNLHEHYKQWGNGMEKIFKSDEDIWRFFSSRFPSLFSCAYNAFKEVSELQKYCDKIAKNEELTAVQPTRISKKKENKKNWELPRFAIGPQGRTIKVHSCVITFPPGAVKKTTEFQFSVTSSTKHCPAGYIIITPTLKCKPSMKFHKPVKIQLPTWFSTKSDDVVVAVKQKDDDKPEPETISEMKLNQISNNMVEFECFHFSDIWAMIKSQLYRNVAINITCSLYNDANGNFQFLLCADNEEMLKKQENKLHKRGFKPGPLCLEPMKVKKGDKIKATLKCLCPDGVIFQPTEETFTCTELFAELKYSHSLRFWMTHLPSSEQLLDLQYALTGKNPQHNQQGNINLKWFKTSEKKITGEAEVLNLAQRELQPRVPQELNQEERLEDVFQKEVIKAFVLMPEFKKFARSMDGLKLVDSDVEEICQDNMHSVTEQKMGLLRKWREKMGEDATPERIREIVENYRKKLNEEE